MEMSSPGMIVWEQPFHDLCYELSGCFRGVFVILGRRALRFSTEKPLLAHTADGCSSCVSCTFMVGLAVCLVLLWLV